MVVAESQLATNVQSFIETALKGKDFEIIPLAGDASNRRYYRVIFNEQSYVLMVWEPFVDDDNYPFLSVLQHFHKHKVHVPKVIAKSPQLGVVLLEDLGDLTLERKFWETQNQQLVLPFYKQAIDELIKIHYLASADRSSSCTAFKIAFDKAKFLWEMNYGREHLIEKLAGVQLSTKEASTLQSIFESICERLDNEEKRISHRDYHSRNLMIKLGQMRVIDFQDARLGPIQYDLVSLVHDSYVDLEDTLIRDVLGYYFEKADEHLGQRLDRNHFREVFRLQLVQRCFKACGSFASFRNLRNDERYLKYISKTLRKVALQLEILPEYKGFAEILDRYDLLNRNYEGG